MSEALTPGQLNPSMGVAVPPRYGTVTKYRHHHYYIPMRMMDGIRRYIEHGIEPGDFLTAVIDNDLREACGRADDENLGNLPAFVAYFYNDAPSGCSGSPENRKAWIAKFKEVPDAVLKRKTNEYVVIELPDGRLCKVFVVETRSDTVKIGFEFPADIAVHRSEVYEKIQGQKAR